MKVKVILLLLVVVLLSGCIKSEKRLVCTQKSGEMFITFNIDYKGKEITNMSFSYDMDLEKYNEEQLSVISEMDYCATIKNTMINYKDSFKDCVQKIENKKMRIDAELDVEKATKEESNNLSSIEETKENLETSGGYSCVIEEK